MLPPPAAAPAAPAGTLALLCFALLLFGARRGDILHFSQRNVNLVLTLCNFLLPTKCFGLAPPLNPAQLPFYLPACLLLWHRSTDTAESWRFANTDLIPATGIMVFGE